MFLWQTSSFGSCHQTNQPTILQVLWEPGIASRMLGSTHQVGKRWLMESALRRTLWTTLGLACPSMGGSSRLRRAWTTSSCPPPFGPASRTLRRHCSVLKVVRFLAFPSPVVLPLFTAGSIPRCSASCSFAVCGSLFLPLHVPAGVAVPSTPLATTVQRARMWECWVAVDLPWKEAGGRVSVNVAVRDLDIGIPDRADDRRLEVVADGLPLFHGAQIAVDTTLVSVLRRDGTPHP